MGRESAIHQTIVSLHRPGDVAPTKVAERFRRLLRWHESGVPVKMPLFRGRSGPHDSSNGVHDEEESKATVRQEEAAEAELRFPQNGA